MSVRDDDDRPGVGRRARRRGASSRPGGPRAAPRTCGCSPRSRGSTAGRARCSPAGRDGEGRRPDPARLPERRRLLGVLHPALHGAGRRRGLVVRPGRRAGLPGALPVHLPRPPRHARRLRLAAVAHGHRRLAVVRRPVAARLARRPPRHQGDVGPRDRRRRRGHRRQRRRHDVRRGRHRHPSRPGAGAARRRRPPPSARCWPRCRTPPTPRSCTPTRRCCRGPAGPGRRGTSAASPRTGGQVTVTYDLTRLQRLTPRPTTWSPSAARTSSTRRR